MSDQEWRSDEAEVHSLVIKLIESDLVPEDVADEVERFHNMDESQKALELIVEALQ